MDYVHAIDNCIIKYPYNRDDLTRDHPNVSFPANPTAEDLAPFNVFIVELTEKPLLKDPRIQKMQRELPVLKNKKWKEVWSIRSATQEEIDAYDSNNTPQPDWEIFKTKIIQSSCINSSVVSASKISPIAVLMLITALYGIANVKDSHNFVTILKELIKQNSISQDVVMEIRKLAVDSNLPQTFIDSI
jgi:hypothetical protein